MKTTMTTRALGTMFALTLAIPAVAGAQERVGVATTVVGPVTITHVASPPAPLKFKDDVFLNDRVATGEKGFARMLLGGKAIVTAREHSVVTINETPGASTVDLASGRISVAVDKARMRPGEIVEIRTPNAVAGIRGTIVVAEAGDSASTIIVLRGLVDVYRRDPATGNAFGPATPVGVRESVTVRGQVLPTRPQAVAPDHARRLSNDFTAPVRAVPPSHTMPVGDEVVRANAVLTGLTGGGNGQRDVAAGRLENRADKADKNEGVSNGQGTGNGNRPAMAPPTVAAPIMAPPAPLPTATVVDVPRGQLGRPENAVPASVHEQKALKHLLHKK